MSTTNSPVRKSLAVKYPFVTESGQDYRDLESLLNDLGAQSGGYYLLGANNFWHGGIHITDEKFIQHKKDHPVRCMMDGTVIAYRLNKQYPTQKWLPNSQLPAKDLQFSNGFCLVKHEYESPVNQQEGENNGKTNTLTFYSLYMHLADYSTYIAETESSVKTIAITKDTNARNTEDIASVIGKLKQGSIVQVDLQQSPQQATVSGRRHQFYRATVQTPAVGSDPAVTAGLQVYLYSGCFPAGTFTAAEKPKLPGYWKATVTGKSKEPMRIYDSQAHCMQRNVPPVTKLNPEQPCTFQTEKIIKNVTIEGKVHSIAECQFPASATFRGDKVTSGWMIVDDSQVAWEKVEPTEFDSIVKLAEPLPIAAGDPIGFMGIWESPEPPFITGTTKIRYQMHVELFAADDKTKLEAFLSNSAGLTIGKKYLKVPKGSKLYSSDEHGNFVNPDPLLNAARDYVFEESACTQVKDTAGTVFYNLKGIKTGEAATGPVDFAHVKIEGNVKLITQHDWKELGFTIIEETNDDSDGYLNPEKITSPLFQDIFNRVDGINSQNRQGDGVLTGSEIKNALQQDKDLRSDLYKIIAGHPSEWHKTTQNNMKAHADELSVGNAEEYNNANQFETDRFLQCEYVSQIDGLTQKLWHFHPMITIESLFNSSYPRTPINGNLIPLEFLSFYNKEVIEESDYVEAAETLECEVAAIKAVSKTETGSSGSYFKFQGGDDFVPAILFERHHFHRHTNGVYDRYTDISNRDPGGYGEHRMQYPKLIKAYMLDKKAALMSASWGKFQILASNYSLAGYSSPEEFVLAMSKSEKNQLKAFVSFIQSNRVLLQAIRDKDWLVFANTYNGPRQNGYDLRMERNYNESI